MLREILWQEPGYFDCDEPDKLHHTATLVSQNMTVEHVRAGEVHKLWRIRALPGATWPLTDTPAGTEITSCYSGSVTQ
jgi:hypothetical protein